MIKPVAHRFPILITARKQNLPKDYMIVARLKTGEVIGLLDLADNSLYYEYKERIAA